MDEAVIQSAELVVRELTEIVTNKVLILIFSSILERNESFSKKKKTTRAQTSRDFVGLESARNARKRKSAIVNVRTAKRSDL